MEVYIFALLILIGLIYTCIKLSSGKAKAETKAEQREAELDIIQENIKAKYANIDHINNLSEPERTRLRQKWTKKS